MVTETEQNILDTVKEHANFHNERYAHHREQGNQRKRDQHWGAYVVMANLERDLRWLLLGEE